MRTEQPTECFVPLQKLRARMESLNRFKPPPPSPVILYITDRSKVSLLIWFSVLLVLVSVSVLTYCNFSHFPLLF